MAGLDPAPPAIRPIARKLTRSILVYAAICVCVIGSVQAMISWMHARAEFEVAITNIGQTHLPLLSISIWDIEPEAVRRQLKQMVDQREIGFVRLTARTGQIFEFGDAGDRRHGDTRVFAIPQPGGSNTIAQLEVTADPRALYQELAYAVGVALIGYLVLTAVTCLLVMMVLRRELERPLLQVAEFARNLKPGNLTTPLQIDHCNDHEPDEIDLVVAGFQTLQAGIDSHIQNLDAQVAARTEALEQALVAIRELSTQDALTGCFNRRLFDERIAQDMLRSQRYERPLSLAFCDVDHFKRINDQYGHGVGDDTLRRFGSLLQRAVRVDLDWVARYGGEEFIIVLPDTALADALLFAERTRKRIFSTEMGAVDQPFTVSASFGVAQYQPSESVQEWLDRADMALYRAKQEGRNRVCG